MKVATKLEVSTMGPTGISTTVNVKVYKENKTEKPITVNILTNEMIIYILAFFLILISLITLSIGMCYCLDIEPQAVIM